MGLDFRLLCSKLFAISFYRTLGCCFRKHVGLLKQFCLKSENYKTAIFITVLEAENRLSCRTLTFIMLFYVDAKVSQNNFGKIITNE